MNTKFAVSLAAITLAASTSIAFAHGDEEDAQPRKYDPAKVEPTDFGKEGDPKKATRTIKVDMTDSMRFTPSDLSIKTGEAVKFVVHNGGKVLHGECWRDRLAVHQAR